MPVILRSEGFVFRIYTADHRPAHVHAFNGDGEAVMVLDGGDGLPCVREVAGMREPDVRRAYRIVEAHREEFLARWRRIHEQ